MKTVKTGDTYTITAKVNVDLNGSTVRWLLRKPKTTGAPIVLDSYISNAALGEVSHDLTGTLEIGLYNTEIEVNQGGVIYTFPSDTYEQLKVISDLDM